MEELFLSSIKNVTSSGQLMLYIMFGVYMLAQLIFKYKSAKLDASSTKDQHAMIETTVKFRSVLNSDIQEIRQNVIDIANQKNALSTILNDTKLLVKGQVGILNATQAKTTIQLSLSNAKKAFILDAINADNNYKWYAGEASGADDEATKQAIIKVVNGRKARELSRLREFNFKHRTLDELVDPIWFDNIADTLVKNILSKTLELKQFNSYIQSALLSEISSVNNKVIELNK